MSLLKLPTPAPRGQRPKTLNDVLQDAQSAHDSAGGDRLAQAKATVKAAMAVSVLAAVNRAKQQR